MPDQTLRLARAMRLLQIDADAGAEPLADVLWLARVLPRARHGKEEPGPKMARKKPVRKPAKERSTTEPPVEVTPSPTREPGPPAPRTGIYAPERARAGDATMPATVVTVPAGEALPHRLLLERALKPFLKRYPSRRLRVLDEPATAEASAERQNATPVFRPAPERWFDVALLVEHSDAMQVWSETIRELQALLGRHGAFRQVRVWRYIVRGGDVMLSTVSGQPVLPRVVADPEGRRLCLFLTNGTSPEWRKPPLVEFVRKLGERCVVAILQMLPRRAWAHTALGDALEYVQALVPGTPNAHMQAQDPFSGLVARVPDAGYIPMLTLETERVAAWARFVMSPRRLASAAVRLEPQEAIPQPSPGPTEKPPGPEQHLAAFRSIASPGAFQLMRLLAATPLTLPIMRLVQRSIPGAREQVQLAEVLLSGLVERVTPADAAVPAEQVFYDFVAGVREFLNDTLSSREAQKMDEVLRPAQERLRAFVEQQTGVAVKDFRALLADPDGLERLPASARPFLEVSRRVYERRGILTAGPAAPLVRELRVLRNPNGRPESVAISADGRWALSSYAEGSGITRWNLENATPTTSYEGLDLGASASVAMNGDGSVGIVASGLNLAVVVPAEIRFASRTSAAPYTAIALSPDGRIAISGNDAAQIEEWDVPGHQRLRSLQSDWGPIHRRFGPIRCLAVSGDGRTVLAGSDSGLLVRYTGVETGEVLREFDTPVTAVALSYDARRAVSLSPTEGLTLWNLDRAPAGNLLDQPLADCAAVSADGRVAVAGHIAGTIKVWDLNRGGALSHIFQHGSGPIKSVAISGDGRRAISASEDLRVWDLSRLISSSAPAPEPAVRKAKVSRRVIVAGPPESFNLTEYVRSALLATGHSVLEDGQSEDADYVIVIGESSPPQASDVLNITDIAQLSRLLDELDLDPPGALHGLPPPLENRIPRLRLENELTTFFISGLRKTGHAYIRTKPFSGPNTVISAVLRKLEVRRAFPGGIYWNVVPPTEGRKGARLVVRVNSRTRIRRGSDERPIMTVTLTGSQVSSTRVPVLEVGYLSDAEAVDYLRVSGVAPPWIAATGWFHQNVPLLVALVAGALKRQVTLPAKARGGVRWRYDFLAREGVRKLDDAARIELIRLAIFQGGDPHNPLIPKSQSEALAAARDFGWLANDSGQFSLVPSARLALAQLFPPETKAAHEFVCQYYEEQAGQGSLPHIYWPEHLIGHARKAGGAARVEALLRHPPVLANYLQGAGENLLSQIKGLGFKNFLGRLRDQLIFARKTRPGVFRWSVRTGADPDASLVEETPVPSTVEELIAQERPPDILDSRKRYPEYQNRRLEGVERTVFKLEARIVRCHLQQSGHYKLILQGATGQTMTANCPYPDPKFVNPSSRWARQIAIVRSQLLQRIMYVPRILTHVNEPVRIRGVGFFNHFHGQSGMPPNGIELTPILSIEWLAASAKPVGA